ncbi:MAG TPA: hypothetical protein VK458_19285, partial [Myxococcaceae bacterium]|nr:hypothetical protein [Myxococcaceae bacterium]
MLTRYSEWKKPTDGAYAFQLRALAPCLPAPGVRSDIRQVAREVLGDEAAERFERRVYRWSGPEDVVGEAGEKPYEGAQLSFEERA